MYWRKLKKKKKKKTKMGDAPHFALVNTEAKKKKKKNRYLITQS